MVMKDRYWHKSPEGNDKCIFKIYKQNSPKKSKYWLHKLLPADKQKPNEIYALRPYEHIISFGNWDVFPFG